MKLECFIAKRDWWSFWSKQEHYPSKWLESSPPILMLLISKENKEKNVNFREKVARFFEPVLFLPRKIIKQPKTTSPTTLTTLLNFQTFFPPVCNFCVNPIPTGHGRNQLIYERHMTKSGRNRVKNLHFTHANSAWAT